MLELVFVRTVEGATQLGQREYEMYETETLLLRLEDMLRIGRLWRQEIQPTTKTVYFAPLPRTYLSLERFNGDSTIWWSFSNGKDRFDSSRLEDLSLLVMQIRTCLKWLKGDQSNEQKKVSNQSQRVPRYVVLSLAGQNLKTLASTKSYTVAFDDQKGYYLIRLNEGGVKRLVLVPKIDQLWRDELGPYKARRIKLPSLTTDRGVSIGDTPRRVLSMLGTPANDFDVIEGDPLKTGEGTFLYKYFGGRLNGWSYTAWYSFVKGRLREVSLTIQYGPEVAG